LSIRHTKFCPSPFPLACLAGFAVNAALDYLTRLLAKTRFNLASPKPGKFLGLTAKKAEGSTACAKRTSNLGL